MDLSHAAFGLDMQDASRVYFINPVLNPQVQAQAIGRVRRISQNKPVSVETLVLKNSLDEVILQRKEHMTQAEHRQAKSILDIRPIYNWIKNARITPMSPSSDSYTSQMTTLQSPQAVFGRGFGVTTHPDDGIYVDENHRRNDKPVGHQKPLMVSNKLKRPYEDGPGSKGMTIDGSAKPPNQEATDPGSEGMIIDESTETSEQEVVSQPARRVRFASD